MTFEELLLNPSLCAAVRAQGYSAPTPIQQKAIPHALAGKDVIGCAQTGTGKTAAFALPILQRLAKAAATPAPRCLILTPTRELASQIAESFSVYGKGTGLRHTLVFGGVGEEKQIQALRRGVDIVVATPGRLLALMSQRAVSFQSLEILVLDEADRMLDMGFIHDVKRIVQTLPRKRQTLFFSATMPPDIQALASSMLVSPVRVEVAPASSTVEAIEQKLFHVSRENKRALLLHVLKSPAVSRAIVFTRTKSGANRVARHLEEAGVATDAIHGNKSQNARERALAGFKAGTVRILVATDIAARGIDVDGVTHVINFDLPNIPESYVHRIGRTGRAGAGGVAWSFCDGEERAFLRDIERSIRQPVPVMEDHPFKPGTHVRSAPQTDSDRSSGARTRPAGRGRPGRASGGRGWKEPRAESSPRAASVPVKTEPTAPPPGRRYPKWG